MAEILPLPRTSQPTGALNRPRGAILADLDALHARARDLYVELAAAGDDEAGAPRRAPAIAAPDEVLSLQRAAHAIGWSTQRLRRHIVRHNLACPRDPIGYQPGGVANAPWCVPLTRLRRYVRDQRD